METSTTTEILYDFKYEDVLDYYELDNETFKSEDMRTEFIITLSTVTLLSLIGNVLVVVISVCCMRLRSLTSIFILNLALSDLLFTVGLVLRVYHLIWGLTLRDAACKVIHYTFPAGFYSSIMFLVLMSVQQYTTMVHPHSGWKKRRCITCLLIFVWVVSLLAALPVLVPFKIFAYSRLCMESHKTAFFTLGPKENIVFVCAFLFLGVYYMRIVQTVVKLPTNQRHKATGLAFLLVLTFFICWAPYSIVNFLDIYFQIKFSPQHLDYASYICHLLVFTRCCLNPVIYALFGLIFPKAVRDICQAQATLSSEQIEMEEHRADEP